MLLKQNYWRWNTCIPKLATNTIIKAKINEVKIEITNLATTAALNGKLNAVKNNIPNITNLTAVGTAALTAVENKIPNYSKYITTPEVNKLTVECFAARLEQANLASKSDIANFVKKTDFDDELKNLNKYVTSNKTKHVLFERKLNELSKIVEGIWTKGLTKDLLNGYKVLIQAKYFSSGIL